MTVQSAALVADLKALVLRLEDDLRERVQTQPAVLVAWQDEHRRAAAAERTASTWQAWRDDRVTQAAVAWVLTTVFVRFCEDNALLRPVWISGPPARRQEALNAEAAYFRAHPEDTHREWLLQAIEHLRRTPATAALVDERSALWSVSPSGRAATALLALWRERTEEGELVRDFADPALDTRFLGDLYQDLSEHAKKTYALLQTPDFVEEFILDRTLEPALAERPLEGFKLIDPACGSGHFLLGAFARLLDCWQRHKPGSDARQLVQKALDAVWGVDVNPFAVAITRFRLTVVALQACDETSLERSLNFSFHVLAGDSLLQWHNQLDYGHAYDLGGFGYAYEDVQGLAEILQPGRYDVVVGNPPYITVRDAAQNAHYRSLYPSCHRQYALSIPFMERFYELAKLAEGDHPAGWTGQITSNSFMKREFGSKLIEEFLSKQDLRLVIDTSGAFIPGHGTPTVIIVGRRQSPEGGSVRAVLGRKSEPGVPHNPVDGSVWQSIVRHVDEPGWEDEWLSVAEHPRSALAKHPWSLSGGGAAQVLQAIDYADAAKLGALGADLGFYAITGEDDAFLTPQATALRKRIEVVRPMVLGDGVRDYRIGSDLATVFPYGDNLARAPREKLSQTLKYLWPSRRYLQVRRRFGIPVERIEGLEWYEFREFYRSRLESALTISYAFVATHNHFVLDRGGKVFNRSAPVVKLSKGATEDDHLTLLGVLNSSTACFWLKQNSHDKGSQGVNEGVKAEAWERFFEFTGTTLQDYPLPKESPLQRARTLDTLAQELSAQQVSALIQTATPTADLLLHAQAAQASLRGLMIAQQEELDWEVYRSYGLLEEALVCAGEPPELKLGERAFEIVLARKVEAGEEDTAWFARHGSTPITAIPAHWPAGYRELVQRRIDAIGTVGAIRLLEAPEYKRRWASEPFEVQAEKALRTWLLDRLELRELWFSQQGHPTPKSVSQIADELGRDAEFVSVVELWRGKGVRLVDALSALVEPEAIPYLAAHRLKDPGLRKFVDWQRTWELQRQEDAMRPAEDAPEAEKKAANARADKYAATIPVPPKYTSADFRKQTYWSARGKLDVPKERFIAYPGAGRATDPTALLGWAGWDHAQQSLALATIIAAREGDRAPDEVLVPLVAGMAELQPWVQQWHAEVDTAFGQSPAEFTGQELARRARQVGRSLEQLAAWRPPASTRGRRAKA